MSADGTSGNGRPHLPSVHAIEAHPQIGIIHLFIDQEANKFGRGVSLLACYGCGGTKLIEYGLENIEQTAKPDGSVPIITTSANAFITKHVRCRPK